MIYAALAALAGVVAALVLVMRWGMRAKDETMAAMTMLSATRDQLASVAAQAERDAFEIKATKEALATAERRIELLSKELADAMERSSLGAGLADNDVRGRVLRAAQAARARGQDGLPAQSVEVVPDPAAARRSDSADLPPLTPIDVLR